MASIQYAEREVGMEKKKTKILSCLHAPVFIEIG